jgi:ribosome-associated protein
MIEIPGLVRISESDLQWSFSRSSGPGGQNVNKVNSKATLRWIVPQEFLSSPAGRRFKRIAGRFVTLEDHIVIQSQQHRDRHQNMSACRNKLKSLLIAASIPPRQRVATKPSAASKRRRLNDKRMNAQKKQIRRSLD